MSDENPTTCPVCFGGGKRSLSWGRLIVDCRACAGTGDYPDAERIAGLLDERARAALCALSDAAKHRDGTVMTGLKSLGLIGFPRSGDNACPLTKLGRGVRAALQGHANE